MDCPYSFGLGIPQNLPRKRCYECELKCKLAGGLVDSISYNAKPPYMQPICCEDFALKPKIETKREICTNIVYFFFLKRLRRARNPPELFINIGVANHILQSKEYNWTPFGTERTQVDKQNKSGTIYDTS
jgi:hypothetical protein